MGVRRSLDRDRVAARALPPRVPVEHPGAARSRARAVPSPAALEEGLAGEQRTHQRAGMAVDLGKLAARLIEKPGGLETAADEILRKGARHRIHRMQRRLEM